jgi:hypothetical protein
MNHDIFISYSSKQKSIADGVCHYLEENGFKCWMAPRDIPVGSEYGDLIEEAIKTSKVVILVFSQAASVSKWVKGEINIAFSNDKPILPFRVDNTELTGALNLMLNQMHWIDAFPHFADKLPALLNSIFGLIAKSESQETINKFSIISPSEQDCPKGAINGIFSVSPTKRVYFSPGNLQYCPYKYKTEYCKVTGSWRFAKKQYEIIGADNGKISSSLISHRVDLYEIGNKGWIDLFGWGTGGNPTKRTKWPIRYRGFSDWGHIFNGNLDYWHWHTLSIKEWMYVFNNRYTASGVRYAKAFVNNVNGVMIFPDDWDASNILFKRINYDCIEHDNNCFVKNTISVQEWDAFEKAGVVFLPAAGWRHGTQVYNAGICGHYWSATPYNLVRAYNICIDFGAIDFNYYERCYGKSVRLVCSVEDRH